MENSSVSVVMPCFNAERFLAEALESVMAQTVPVLEVLVVDDGSTDRSASIAEAFGPPVRVIRQSNQGESVARNIGMEEAKGDWIGFLDADDVWAPDKLERQLLMLRESGHRRTVCIHTWFYFFGARQGAPPIPGCLGASDYSLPAVLTDTFIIPSSALVHRSVTSRFPTWTRVCEDGIFFLDLTTRHPDSTLFVPDRLVGYRKHQGQQTSSPGYSEEQYRAVLRWIRDTDLLDSDRAREASRVLRRHQFNRLRAMKARRDWPDYWAMRTFLDRLAKDEACDDCDLMLLREPILPFWMYAINDKVDELPGGKWVARSGHAMARSIRAGSRYIPPSLRRPGPRNADDTASR